MAICWRSGDLADIQRNVDWKTQIDSLYLVVYVTPYTIIICPKRQPTVFPKHNSLCSQIKNTKFISTKKQPTNRETPLYKL